VTDAAVRPAPGVWRRRLIVILLAASVLLNLCFVAGFAWTRLHGPPPPGERFHRMGAELRLDGQQQGGFERYVRTVRARSALMREEVEPLIGAAWAEMGKSPADEAQIQRLYEQAAEKRRGYQRDITRETLAFLATLSAEQRAKFVAVAGRRGRWHRPGP